MLLSIVLINFQSRAFLEKCLFSLEKHLKNGSFEVILFNNDPVPLKENAFSILSFKLTLLQSKKNIGFGAGCNQAVGKARGEFLLFLNPDSILLDNSLWQALSFLENKPEIGAIGGKILLLPTKKLQPWTSGSKTTLAGIIFRNTFNAPWKKSLPHKTDWVSGTALLVRSDLFQKIGGFDEKFFMYFEDQDLCLRIKKAGYSIFFLPFFKIGHYDGKSWANLKQKKSAFYHSQDIFFQKHRPAWEYRLLKLFRFILKGR